MKTIPRALLLTLSSASCGLVYDFNDFETEEITQTLSVRGTVDGLVGDQRVGLSVNGGSARETANGPFVLPTRLKVGDTYAVVAQATPTGIGCMIESGEGRLAKSEDINGVLVHCGNADARLESLALSDTGLAFAPDKHEYDVTAIVPAIFDGPRMTVTAKAKTPNARITIGNASLEQGVAYQISTDAGEPVTIHVTTVVGTSTDYTLRIKRDSTVALDVPSSIADELGTSLAVSGNEVAIGAPTLAATESSVHVFRRSSFRSWARETTLVVPAASGVGKIEMKVAFSNDTIAVGMAGDASTSGVVYIFTRNPANKEWSPVPEKIKSPSTDISFGSAVAMRGDTLVVGAPTTAGVYVFKRNTVGEWDYDARLESDNPTPGMSFGHSVDILGETIVVGAPGDDTPSTRSAGGVFRFERVIGGLARWEQREHRHAPKESEYGRFGSSVALSEEGLLVVGQPQDPPIGEEFIRNPGKAFVFRRGPSSSPSLVHEATLSAADFGVSPPTLDAFGKSVAIRGDVIAVGAPEAFKPATSGPIPGAVYLYRRDATATTMTPWKKHAAVDALSQTGSLGRSVALLDDALVAGAPVDRRTFVFY